MPKLLPDCGHSYCEQCIEENSIEIGFGQRRRRTTVFTENDDDEDDSDLVSGINSPFGKSEAVEEESKWTVSFNRHN